MSDTFLNINTYSGQHNNPKLIASVTCSLCQPCENPSGNFYKWKNYKALLLLLLEPEGPVDALDQKEDDGLPADQPADPVQQLAVHHVWLLPWVRKHSLEINFFVAVWTGLLLADYAPASDAELVELVAAGQSKCVLNDPLLPDVDQQLVATHGAGVPLQSPLRDTLLLVVTDIGGHLFSADFSKISSHDSEVEGIEHRHYPGVHPGRRLCVEDEVEAEERGEHGKVSEYAEAVAHLVGQEEPLVHQAGGSALYWLLEGLPGDDPRDKGEDQPDQREPPPQVPDTQTDRNHPHSYKGTEVVGVGTVLPPLDEDDLGEEEDDQENENHLGVHLRVSGVLLVHSYVF